MKTKAFGFLSIVILTVFVAGIQISLGVEPREMNSPSSIDAAHDVPVNKFEPTHTVRLKCKDRPFDSCLVLECDKSNFCQVPWVDEVYEGHLVNSGGSWKQVGTWLTLDTHGFIRDSDFFNEEGVKTTYENFFSNHGERYLGRRETFRPVVGSVYPMRVLIETFYPDGKIKSVYDESERTKKDYDATGALRFEQSYKIGGVIYFDSHGKPMTLNGGMILERGHVGYPGSMSPWLIVDEDLENPVCFKEVKRLPEVYPVPPPVQIPCAT